MDTGSSHNVCSPAVLKHSADATRCKYTVSTAGDNTVKNAAEYKYKLTVQNVTTCFAACEMSLPPGVDILLGQSWLTEHQATLLTWSGQVNFMDDKQVPACWVKQKKLMNNPFNANLTLASAATVSRSKQVYIACVRAAEQEENVCAVTHVAAAHSDSATGDTNTQPVSESDAGLQNVFVEQQSAVQGIKELVQQFQGVFAEPPDELPPDRGFTHAIPVLPD